jgi:hypothetical protein
MGIRLFFLSVFLFSSAVQAAESSVSPDQNADTCSVRIYSDNPSASIPEEGLGACSGTMVDAETLVTAAHCMTEAFSGYGKDINKLGNLSAYIALNNSARATPIRFQSGQGAAFAPAAFASDRSRQAYIEKGDVTLSKNDFLIIKLKTPLKTLVGKNCPRLPRADDCARLGPNGNLASIAKDLTANFFTTVKDVASAGSSFGRSVATEPGRWIFHSKGKDATSLSSINKSPSANPEDPGACFINFTSGDSPVVAKRGDSGTGVCTNDNEGKPVLMGVQSAVVGGGRLKDYSVVAPLCPHIANNNWADIAARTALQFVQHIFPAGNSIVTRSPASSVTLPSQKIDSRKKLADPGEFLKPPQVEMAPQDSNHQTGTDSHSDEDFD